MFKKLALAVMCMVGLFVFAGVSVVEVSAASVKYYNLPGIEPAGTWIEFDKDTGTITKADVTITSADIPTEIDGAMVTSIGYRAFNDCTGMTTITIPDGVTSRDFQFYGCISLTAINASSGSKLYSSQDGVLFNKDKTEIVRYPLGKVGAYIIPEDVRWIRNNAFDDCSNLTTIGIPSSMTSGDFEFSGCTGLTDINVHSGNQRYSSQDGILFNKNKTEIVRYPQGKSSSFFPIPSSVTSIGWWTFNGCNSLTTILIPHGVTTIGQGAFSDCTGLSTINIPESVTLIEGHAFNGCANLTTINIPEGITSIDFHTFEGCSSLSTIDLPDGVTSIGSSAFMDCINLTTLNIPDGVTSIETQTFWGCTNLTTVSIPDSVSSIGINAFLGCTSLTEINLPVGVNSVTPATFNGCSSLTAINVSSSNPSYSSADGVLYNKAITEIIKYPDAKAGAYTIPSTITSIEYMAFMGCYALTELTISDKVTSIDTGTFNGCRGLTAIKVSSSNPSYSSVDGVLYNKDKTELLRYPQRKNSPHFTIPDGITSIGVGAFSQSIGLSNVTIPNSVNLIDDSAFSQCFGLDRVVIPYSATSIGNGAFYNCLSLTDITLPGNIVEIGNSAFDACFELNTVYYGSNQSRWSAIDVGFNNDPLLNATIHYNHGKLESLVVFDSGLEDAPDRYSDIEAYWDDDWFSVSSTDYNHDLATTAMALSGAAYIEGSAKDALVDFGFSSVKEENYSHKYTGHDIHIVGHTFGKKEINVGDESYTLISVIVRGTPSNEEWYSNFDLGIEYLHQGFYRAFFDLEDNLNAYIDEHEINKNNVKFYITGHSRGAAVANILAAEMTDQYSNSNVYSYTFATPTVNQYAKKIGYENIFNIVNNEDFVTRMPLELWGYKRYGVDKYLPSKSTYGDRYDTGYGYGTLKNRAAQAFKTLTGEGEFNVYSGTAMTDKLVKDLYRLASHPVDYYYNLYEGVKGWLSPYMYFYDLADVLVVGGSFNEAIFYTNGFYHYSPINDYFINDKAPDPKVLTTHSMATYYAWMSSCSEAELFAASNQRTRSLTTNSTFKRLTIACPVDVNVYGENDDLLASVVGEVVVNDTLAVVVNDGVKTIDLPGDQNYSIDITAYDAGTMSYTIEEMEVIGSISTALREVSYDNIPLVSGDSFTGDISNLFNINTYNYNLTKNGTDTITSSSDTSAFTISFDTGVPEVFVEDMKTVDGKLLYMPVAQREGYSLVGWFDGTGEGATEIDIDHVFTGDTTIYAKWGDVVGSVSGSISSYMTDENMLIQVMQGETEMGRYTVPTSEHESGLMDKHYIVEDLPYGTYSLVVTKPGHITQTITGIVVDESSNILEPVSLIGGDVNGDETVDVADIEIVQSETNYNKTTTDTGVNTNADVNGDGVINFYDVSIIRNTRNFGKTE